MVVAVHEHLRLPQGVLQDALERLIERVALLDSATFRWRAMYQSGNRRSSRGGELAIVQWQHALARSGLDAHQRGDRVAVERRCLGLVQACR